MSAGEQFGTSPIATRPLRAHTDQPKEPAGSGPRLVPLLAERRLLVVFLFLGFAAAMVGAYWDAETHTNVGRDSFFIPPHLAIYAGIAGAGAVLMLWAAYTANINGDWRSGLSHPPMAMAAIAAGVILVAAPIDNAWHAAFSRDAVLWSPPHLLGVVSAIALPTSALLEMARAQGRRRGILVAIAGAFTLAGLVAIVTEYETDVPQFAESLYLPILCGVTALAFTIIQKAARFAWSATICSIVYLGLMGLVALFLLAVGYVPPILPLLFIPAVVSDWLLDRDAPFWLRGGVHAVVVFAVYVPYLDFVRGGIQIESGDIVVGLPAAIVASCVAYALVPARPLRIKRPPRGPLLVALMVGCLAVLAAPAAAHDPGQGPKLGKARLDAIVTGNTVVFSGHLLQKCDTFSPTRMAARRAGLTVYAPLVRVGPCDFRGSMLLRERGRSRGRWFVYAELRHFRRSHAETWLLVHVGGGAQHVTKTRWVYRPPARKAASTIKIASSAVMFAVILVLLTLVILLARRFDPTTDAGSASA